MEFKKNVFVQIEKFNWKNFSLAKDIAQKLGNGLYIVLVSFDKEEEEKIRKEVSKVCPNNKINSFSSFGEAKTFLEDFKPTLVMLSQEKINPLLHIFKHTDAEKFIKGLNNFNILLLWEEAEKAEKILINIDYETATEKYIQIAYSFTSKVAKEFSFIYSFYESFYEHMLMKTHADEEAKQLVAEMFKEHILEVKNLLKRALGGEDLPLLVIKGDPKKEVPYYSRTHGYDILIINHSIENKESYIENTENSIGIFLD
ncbi:MAG: hypothetical protein GXO21_02985 [Aquificae bacterium]|nr:hypothetical protein [Aquificota bacterium]